MDAYSLGHELTVAMEAVIDPRLVEHIVFDYISAEQLAEINVITQTYNRQGWLDLYKTRFGKYYELTGDNAGQAFNLVDTTLVPADVITIYIMVGYFRRFRNQLSLSTIFGQNITDFNIWLGLVMMPVLGVEMDPEVFIGFNSEVIITQQLDRTLDYLTLTPQRSDVNLAIDLALTPELTPHQVEIVIRLLDRVLVNQPDFLSTHVNETTIYGVLVKNHPEVALKYVDIITSPPNVNYVDLVPLPQYRHLYDLLAARFPEQIN